MSEQRKHKSPNDDFEGFWTRRQMRFSNLVNSGLAPHDALWQMDKEDGRRRTDSARWAELAKLKIDAKELIHFGENPEDMSDDKWENYQDYILQSILSMPKEFNRTALDALDRMSDRRKLRKYGSHEAVMETLKATMDELARLCDSKIWANRTEDSQVCQGAVSRPGGIPDAGEEQRRNALRAAIRGTLETFRGQQEAILGTVNRTLGELGASFEPAENTVLVS